MEPRRVDVGGVWNASDGIHRAVRTDGRRRVAGPRRVHRGVRSQDPHADRHAPRAVPAVPQPAQVSLF